MLLLALLACKPKETPWGGELSDALEPGDPHVLVLIVDGVRVDEITGDWTSDLTDTTGEAHAGRVWSDVVADGTVVRSIHNAVLTSTAPGHATLTTGRAEPIFTVAITDGDPGLYYPQLPTVFDEARAQMGWEREDTVLFANSVVMPSAVATIHPGYEELGGTWAMLADANGSVVEDDTRLVNELEVLLANAPPPVVYVNIHDSDRAGHAGGDYVGRVTEVDRLLADLWTWIDEKQPTYRDNLLVIVTTDHGRHRHDLDGGWKNHGDACGGCREQPLILFGEGVRAGVEDDGRYLLADVAPTVAAHLGIDLPYAQGLPLSSLADTANVPGRSGEVAVAVAGQHLAAQRWRDDFDARSEVVVDGEVVSTPGVFAAEAPSLAETSLGTVACWREYTREENDDGYFPWTARCLADTGDGWTDIGFPDPDVGPFWRARIAERDGRVWVAWLHTPKNRGVNGDDDGVWAASWTPDGGWSDPSGTDVQFTTVDVEVAATEDGLLAAAGTSLGDPLGPYSRRIATWGFSTSGAAEGEGEVFDFEYTLSSPRRVERPALAADGDHVRLAMLAFEEGRRAVYWVESTDGGDTWTGPAVVAEGELFAHVSPRWDGDALVYAALDDAGDAALCRAVPGDTSECISLGSPRIDGFDVEDGVATASVDVGVGEWEVVQVGW
ncbi:MAG: sulfatase-like hydrolase/transferase [Myxococcota bacterium]